MVVSDEIIEKIEDLSTFRLAILGLAHVAVVSMFWNHRWKMEKKGRPWSKSSVNDDGNRRPVALKMMTSLFNFLSHPINLYLSENRRRSVGVERPMSRFVNYLIKTFVWHPEVNIAMSQSSWPPELK